jgi:hypothetical protein
MPLAKGLPSTSEVNQLFIKNTNGKIKNGPSVEFIEGPFKILKEFL